MELNQKVIDFLEIVSKADLTKAANRKKLESNYKQVTTNLNKEDMLVFNKIYKQYLDLKLATVDKIITAIEEDINELPQKKRLRTG